MLALLSLESLPLALYLLMLSPLPPWPVVSSMWELLLTSPLVVVLAEIHVSQAVVMQVVGAWQVMMLLILCVVILLQVVVVTLVVVI